MAINKKLVHFKTFANFKNELDAGNILDTSIVFVKDRLWLYTHGLYYYCSKQVLSDEYVASSLENESLEPVPGDTLEEAISKLHKAIINNEEVTTKTFFTVKDSVGLDEHLKYVPANASLSGKNITEAIDYIADNINLSEDYSASDLENEELNPVAGDSIETAVSKLHKAVLDNESIAADAFVTLKELIGLSENGLYEPESENLQGKTIVLAIDYLENSKVSSVAGKTGDVILNKADVGLDNVDNTSDLDKPISDATQNALNTITNYVDTINNSLGFSETGEYLSSSDILQNKTVTEAIDRVAQEATSSQSGLLSAADKAKLDEINYTHPEFRWGDNSSADNTIGKILLSMDSGNTWTDLSPNFTNSLRIKEYISSVENLPTDASAGDIYAVGPVFIEEDIEQANPIYTIYVYTSSGWVDNGKMSSLPVGITLELGLNTDKVISLKVVTDELNAIKDKFVVLSEGEFEALESKDANIFYFIYEE